MRQLIRFELKKIIKKTSTWVTFFTLFLIQATLGFSGYINDLTHGYEIGSDAKAAEKISGRTLDDTLLGELIEAIQKRDTLGDHYKESPVYDEILPYRELEQQLIYAHMPAAPGVTADKFYTARETLQKEILFPAFSLTNEELNHWNKQEASVKKPFIYEYAGTWKSLADMNGVYMTSMLLIFFTAVCLVGVFTDENRERTDQLLLCAKYGRKPLYLAKLTAGSIIVLAATALLEGVYLLGHILYYGPSGFSSSIQMGFAFSYPHNLTIGETCLILIGLLFLSSLLIGLFTMLLAQALHHGVGAMAILIGGLFAARLIPIPMVWRTLSMLWNLIPINLLKVDQGFLDLRLYPLFTAKLTSYQLAPILYLALTAVLILFGRRLWGRQNV